MAGSFESNDCFLCTVILVLLVRLPAAAQRSTVVGNFLLLRRPPPMLARGHAPKVARQGEDPASYRGNGKADWRARVDSAATVVAKRFRRRRRPTAVAFGIAAATPGSMGRTGHGTLRMYVRFGGGACA